VFPSPTLIQHSLGIPSQSNEAGKKIKGIQTDKEVAKLSLFIDDMILFITELKKHTKTPSQQKQLQQNSRIQNQLTKISSLSIHK
jgi:hypothetical protein